MELIQRIGDENYRQSLREADTAPFPAIVDFRHDRHVVEALGDRIGAWAVDAYMDDTVPCRFCSLEAHFVDFRVWGEDTQECCRTCLPHVIARDHVEWQVQIEYSPRMGELLELVTGGTHRRVSGVLDEGGERGA